MNLTLTPEANEKGKMARLYFLELERRWNSPEMVMKRAMDYLNQRIEKLQTENLLPMWFQPTW